MARSEVLNVFAEDYGNRARWIFKLMFEELLGIRVSVSNDADRLADVHLNYSRKKASGPLQVAPAGLLSEDSIRKQDIGMDAYKGLPVFFSVEEGDLPFDPFSMAFYLVSRYEEYLPFAADQHGRFPHTESLAFREGFLEKAVVNRLALLLKDLLAERFPELAFRPPEYRFTPSVDIDIAFAHLGKGFVRTWGAMAKLLLKADLKEIRARLKTMAGKTADPYDNFEMLLEVFSAHQLESIFFILAGDPGPYDRNLSTRNPRFAGLINDLAERAHIGVHPSYGAGYDPDRILKEMKGIANAAGRMPEKSRQHFVRMKFPDTCRALIRAGIKDDYSMGYASASGFRASIASPYTFYDLQEEKETSLRMHPFMFMDTTLEDYLGLNPGEYAAAVQSLIRETKEVQGSLMAIWHNYALAGDAEKHRAFREIINLAAKA